MRIVIVGASGGIGRAFVENLADWASVDTIIGTHRRDKPPFSHPKLTWQPLDVTDEAAVATWAKGLGEIDWLINAIGILHTTEHGPEKSIRQIDPSFFLESVAVNALPTLLLAKHTQVAFHHRRPAIFAAISAKVGSIEDNRLGGWFSYRASKAALNMGLRTLSIEWRRTLPHVAVAALHPGTTDTALSRPFQKNVPKAQLFKPDYSVRRMLEVLDGLRPADSGKFRAFDGELLPW